MPDSPLHIILHRICIFFQYKLSALTKSSGFHSIFDKKSTADNYLNIRVLILLNYNVSLNTYFPPYVYMLNKVGYDRHNL